MIACSMHFFLAFLPEVRSLCRRTAPNPCFQIARLGGSDEHIVFGTKSGWGRARHPRQVEDLSSDADADFHQLHRSRLTLSRHAADRQGIRPRSCDAGIDPEFVLLDLRL